MQKSPVYMTKLIMAYCTIVVHCAMTSTSVIQIQITTPNILILQKTQNIQHQSVWYDDIPFSELTSL